MTLTPHPDFSRALRLAGRILVSLTLLVLAGGCGSRFSREEVESRTFAHMRETQEASGETFYGSALHVVFVEKRGTRSEFLGALTVAGDNAPQSVHIVADEETADLEWEVLQKTAGVLEPQGMEAQIQRDLTDNLKRQGNNWEECTGVELTEEGSGHYTGVATYSDRTKSKVRVVVDWGRGIWESVD